MLEMIGEIYQEGRDFYLVVRSENEAYYFSSGRFFQGLTKFADRGCKLSDIDELIPEIEKLEENDTTVD